MPSSRDSGPLGQGGPSDQSGVRRDAQEARTQGSQSGQPKRQEESPPISADGQPASRPTDPASHAPDAEATAPERDARAVARAAGGEIDPSRGVSATERAGGTPDPHATTETDEGTGVAAGGS